MIRAIEGDITKQDVDAIVNAASPRLRGGGGVDGAIHRAAGPGLLQELIERYKNGCATGEAKVTGAHSLAARYVIHAVGPVYRDGKHGEPDLLAACYRNALRAAAELDCASIAFPAISCGVYHYPWHEAAAIAVQTIRATLPHCPSITSVRLVLFDRALYDVYPAELS